MANNPSKKQVDNKNNNNVSTDRQRKGDTSRTSNQGRKEASGGSSNTNNQGRPKGMEQNL